MSGRGWRVAALALLLAGCAAHGSIADISASPGPDPGALAGSWRGTFYQVGSSLTFVEGSMTVDIHDDGTFTWTSKKMGPFPAKDSGTVTLHGRRVVLKDAAGRSVPLVLRGDTLYGVSDELGSEQSVDVVLTRVH